MQDTIWFVLIITTVLGVVATYEWLRPRWRAWKAKQKTESSEPVDLQGVKFSTNIDFVYRREDIEKRVKAAGDELRALSQEGGDPN
jgi:cytochrome c biogenesis protein ResB